jgi:hypothetical protein
MLDFNNRYYLTQAFLNTQLQGIWAFLGIAAELYQFLVIYLANDPQPICCGLC